ncbi:MAG: YigZ family protein [Mahellales bacterium]|jgi:uncharacterized YigZ family protein
MLGYRTVKDYGQAEIVIKKSKFIGHIKKVEDEEQALGFIEEIKRKHWDATHNCYGYIVGEKGQVQRFSDDGEPSGTAGQPILEVLKQENLRNVTVVVTRYFGGILLGAGGLIRAYSKAARTALDKGSIIEKVPGKQLILVTDYSFIGKIKNELYNLNYPVADIEYDSRVRITVNIKDCDVDAIKKRMLDITKGNTTIEPKGDIYIDLDVV